MDKILRELSHGHNVIVGHHATAKLALASSLAIYNQAWRSVVVVGPEELLRGLKVEAFKEDRVLMSSDMAFEIAGDAMYILLEPGSLPHPRAGADVTALSTPGALPRIPRGYRRFRLYEAGPSEFVIRSIAGDFSDRFVVSEGMAREAGERYGRVLDVLRRAMLDFGELRVRDATFILMRELSVDRRVAMKLLGELARRKMIRVRSGRVELA